MHMTETEIYKHWKSSKRTDADMKIIAELNGLKSVSEIALIIAKKEAEEANLINRCNALNSIGTAEVTCFDESETQEPEPQESSSVVQPIQKLRGTASAPKEEKLAERQSFAVADKISWRNDIKKSFEADSIKKERRKRKPSGDTEIMKKYILEGKSLDEIGILLGQPSAVGTPLANRYYRCRNELKKAGYELPKLENQKIGRPRIDTPKVEKPKVESPKVEMPKAEKPKLGRPRKEKPEAEMPKVESLKVAETKTEVAKKSTVKAVNSSPSPVSVPKMTNMNIECGGELVPSPKVIKTAILDTYEAQLFCDSIDDIIKRYEWGIQRIEQETNQLSQRLDELNKKRLKYLSSIDELKELKLRGVSDD